MRVTLQFWDVDLPFKDETRPQMAFKGTMAILLTFDLANHFTFKHLDQWVDLVKQHTDSAFRQIYLIGTKTDLETNVSDEEATQYAQKLSTVFDMEVPFYKTSARMRSGDPFPLDALLKKIAVDLVKDISLEEIKKEDSRFIAKIVILGEGGVGKTSLRDALEGKKFSTQYLATIGTGFNLIDTIVSPEDIEPYIEPEELEKEKIAPEKETVEFKEEMKQLIPAKGKARKKAKKEVAEDLEEMDDLLAGIGEEVETSADIEAVLGAGPAPELQEISLEEGEEEVPPSAARGAAAPPPKLTPPSEPLPPPPPAPGAAPPPPAPAGAPPPPAMPSAKPKPPPAPTPAEAPAPIPSPSIEPVPPPPTPVGAPAGGPPMTGPEDDSTTELEESFRRELLSELKDLKEEAEDEEQFEDMEEEESLPIPATEVAPTPEPTQAPAEPPTLVTPAEPAPSPPPPSEEVSKPLPEPQPELAPVDEKLSHVKELIEAKRKRKKKDEEPLKPARPLTKLERHSLVSYYNKMNPYKNFELQVKVTERRVKVTEKPKIRHVRGMLTVEKEEKEIPLVRVVPVFPGCLVTPREADINIEDPKQKLKFFITPLALGDVPGRVEFWYKGRRISIVETPAKVKSQTTTKIMAVLGAFFGASPFMLELMGVDLNENIRQKLIEWSQKYYPEIEDFIQTEFILLFEMGLFMLLLGAAFVLFQWRKPQKTETTAEKALNLG